MSAAHDLGRDGEDTVAFWYQRHGYCILERNYRTATGEIDLIVTVDRLVVFCEVKTRSSDRHGGGAAAVGHRKQQRIRSVAIEWLRQSDGSWPELRFDVASLRRRAHGFDVDVIEAAF